MTLAEATQIPTHPLEAVFNQHHRRVYAAAYRVTGNAADAEDVLQTVFLRLARQGVATVDEAGPYLHRAAVNGALDLLRSRRRAAAVPLDDARETGSGGEGLAALRADLRAALGQLEPRWAEMFVLRYVEGQDTAEVARAVGTSRAAVVMALFRARRRLKGWLSVTDRGRR